ncbi:MAG: YigZ family protein [Anaerolineae bacterium]|nr:YigZ family protein [Anaerolineae bacterium]CAG1014223.1 IMPACT family member YigZ [Anaerolineae bacterium]
MKEPYHIPAGRVRVEHEVSRSRFIATLDWVETVEAARAFINERRVEMPDASHHVYAFKIGFGGSVTEGVSDDGEPTGTSGPPILAVLRGSNVGDVILVVTRYFGGTKLGTGGLVRAYGDAARAAIAAMRVRLKIPMRQVGLSVDYSYYERVKLIAAAHQAVIDDESFAGEVTLFMTLPESQVESFSAALRELSAGRIALLPLD